MRRPNALTALLAGLALLASGCASIPQQTQPQAIHGAEADTSSTETIEGPGQNVSAADVLRELVAVNGRPQNNYATSRHYLSNSFRNKWKPSRDVTIIGDSFNTVPAPADEQPRDPNETLMYIRDIKKGTLSADGSFLPGNDMYQAPVLLRKQRNDQWRVADMPNEVVTTESEFEGQYKPVTLQFFAPESDVPVPDLRYIAEEPAAGLGARVIGALLDGPSDAMRKAVTDSLENASLDTNVTVNGGVLQVPLTGLANADEETRKRAVTQIVMSLRFVGTNSTIRPLSDGEPLLKRRDWRFSDLGAAPNSPEDTEGMGIADDQLVSLSEDQATALGPAGTGTYTVRSAAQSRELNQLAVVESTGKKQRLRVGASGADLPTTSIEGKTLTRPTWRPAYPGNELSNEVWTVIDGRSKSVVRAMLSQDDTWTLQRVDASEVRGLGKISALRLSPDGTRAAIIAGGKLVVAAVARSDRAVKLRAPRILQERTLDKVVDVDWLEQDSLVVANRSDSIPVAEVSVDGFALRRYNTANLEKSVDSVAAAPDGSVVAATGNGLWESPGATDVWRPHQRSGAGVTKPFFPG